MTSGRAAAVDEARTLGLKITAHGGGDPLKSFDALGKPEAVFVGGRIHRF